MTLEAELALPPVMRALRMRPANAGDVPILQSIELDVAQRYGSDDATKFCLDLPARSVKEHAHARIHGLALIAEVDRIPAGFALAIPQDGRGHLLEVAVAADQQRQGYGRALIAAAEDWAVCKGLRELTLTTFRDVAWNAPFYARLGYEIFDIGPDRRELRALIAAEARAKIDRAPRIAMRKSLSARTDSPGQLE